MKMDFWNGSTALCDNVYKFLPLEICHSGIKSSSLFSNLYAFVYETKIRKAANKYMSRVLRLIVIPKSN